MRIEESRFGQLLRGAAHQATRRETLGALLGGMLLLHRRGEIEATEKARRRRKRKRRQGRRQAGTDLLPIRVQLKNPGATEVSADFVFLEDRWVHWTCKEVWKLTIAPGAEAAPMTRIPWSDALVWLNQKYSIEFWNPVFRTPAVSAAVNGVSMNKRHQCPKRGTRALNHTAIPEGMTFKFKIYDKEFIVERLYDTKYKEFILTLPTNL